MELFTFGVATTPRPTSTPPRACSPAGTWRVRERPRTQHYAFNYNAAQHDTDRQGVHAFRSIRDGSKTIPGAPGAGGMQDGLDLHRRARAASGNRPAACRKLYGFFVNEVDPPDDGAARRAGARVLRSTTTRSSRWCARMLLSPQFSDPANYYTRYSWPAEFVVRAIKEIGWTGSRWTTRSRR